MPVVWQPPAAIRRNYHYSPAAGCWDMQAAALAVWCNHTTGVISRKYCYYVADNTEHLCSFIWSTWPCFWGNVFNVCSNFSSKAQCPLAINDVELIIMCYCYLASLCVPPLVHLMKVVILVGSVVCLPGSRCILSPYLNLDGTAVNDSHAEVIARRAFIKYDVWMYCYFLY